MTGATLTIRFTDDSGAPHPVNVGSLISWSNTIQKRGAATPIVTQGVQNSFPIENGNSQSYSFKFKHKNGQDGLTNAAWCKQMTECIDRWQARTDGCKLIYDPGADNPYVPAMELDGYIKTLDLDYKNDYNEYITGSITFSVGHMNVKGETAPADAMSYDDMYIMMSDPQKENWYALHSGAGTDIYSCVDSVRITAGPESPFEYAIIEMPRKKLMEQIPDLYGNIVDGKNRVFLNIMGAHNMFVQKAESSGDNITVTAYCDAQIYAQKVLNSGYKDTPFEVMKSILTDSNLGLSYSPDNILYKFDQYRDKVTGDVSIPRGTSVYRTLQMCAKLLNCRLFFADNNVYIIDYTISPSTTAYQNTTVSNVSTLLLRKKGVLGQRVVGSSSCDNTGFDPVKNHCTIKYRVKDVEGNVSTTSEEVWDEDKLSCTEYGTLDRGTIDLPELTQAQAKTFAQNYLGYVREPQRSMTFTVRETYGAAGEQGKRWAPCFEPCSAAKTIEDSYNSEKVTNSSMLKTGPAYQKLILSEYTRQYPKGVTTYTFGMIASVELSDNLSQTSTSINS